MDDKRQVEHYRELQQQLKSLLQDETDFIANLANTSALLYHSLPACNWVGFYLWKEGPLCAPESSDFSAGARKLSAEDRSLHEVNEDPSTELTQQLWEKTALRGGQLVLGPFQGQPACVRIDLGKGVCGTAAQRRRTIIASDVHQFEGHIACDVASQSEIVVPMVANDKLIGVLDVDSPIKNRFDEFDRQGLEQAVATLLDMCCFE